MKEGGNFFRNGDWPPRLAFYEYPISFAASDHGPIGRAQNEVFSQTTRLATARNPGENQEAITRKCRLQIFNMMTSHHPRCPDSSGSIGATAGVGVADGGILHPAQIFDVIGVAIRVDGILRNNDAVAIHRENVIFQ